MTEEGRGYRGHWISIYEHDGTGHLRKKCPICKKVFYCRKDWAYQWGYKDSRTFYCSWGHMRVAEKEREKEREKKKNQAEELATKLRLDMQAKRHAGGRPRMVFTPEMEAEIYRRYKEGQRASHVAKKMGIGDHGVYLRYRKWRAEETT